MYYLHTLCLNSWRYRVIVYGYDNPDKRFSADMKSQHRAAKLLMQQMFIISKMQI